MEKNCYSFDPVTGAYVGEEKAYDSAMTPGVFNLPANATFIAPPKAKAGYTLVFTVKTEKWAHVKNEPAEKAPEASVENIVRQKRNRLLQATDWTQMADAPLTENQVLNFRSYRQKLRDIPKQTGFPAAVVWPEAPAL